MNYTKAIFKMANVYRFSGLSLNAEYTIGEHSYRVACLAMSICDEYNSKNEIKVDTLEVLRKALLHDLEETITGDMPSPVKKYGNLREELRDASEHIMRDLILHDSPEPDYYLDLWINDKEGMSGEVITVADKLEGLLVSFYEYKRGNKYIQDSLENHLDWFINDGAELVKKYSYAQGQLKLVVDYFK